MKKFLWGITGALLLVVIFGTIYATVQQSQRSEANYPQIQLAEDVADGLDQKYQPELLVYGKVDMAKSLAPFTIVYNKKDSKVSAGSGFLDGKVPQAPKGVLGASKGVPYHDVTWEPKKGVRIAAVVVEAKDYYVLSGRSLREVEKNESRTLQIALIGGLISLLILGLSVVLHTVTRQYI